MRDLAADHAFSGDEIFRQRALTGSWMNDSGFRIFARMGNLTEVETLKTWTILLALLGVTALGFTLLAARLMPLVS